MACGCIDGSCTCVLTGGSGITVSGAGSAGNPYVISAAPVASSSGSNVIMQSYQYDFADLGGAVGDISLTNKADDTPLQIPANTIVTVSFVEFVNPFTSAGDPTLQLGWATPGFEGAIFNDLMSNLNSFPSGILTMDAMGGIKDMRTIAQDLVLNVSAPDDLTGGLFNVWLEIGEVS